MFTNISYLRGHCLLWPWPFDLLSQARYIRHLILVKLAQKLRRYCIHPVFRVSAYCDLDLWPFIPIANQYIYEPKYICDQHWAKFPSLVCEIWCGVHKVFGTHRLTHSRTGRPECSMPPALFFNDGGGMIRSLVSGNSAVLKRFTGDDTTIH